ncbi:transcription factor HIVEP2 isoform X2 [Lampetra planeri]
MSSGRQPQWSLGCDAAPLGNSVLAASDAKWQPGRAASLLDKSRGGSSPLDVLLQAVEPDLTLLRQANDDESGDVAEQRYGTLTAEQQTQMRPKPREPGLASPHAYVLAQEKHGGDDGQFNKTASAEHRHKGGAQPEQSLHCGDDESQNRIQVAPRPGEQRPQTQWGEQQQHLRQQRFMAPPHGGARYRVRGGVVQYVYPTQYSRAGPPAPPSQQPPHVPLPAQGTRRAGPLPSSQEGPSESSGPYAAPCYVPAEAKGGQVYAQYRGQSGRGRPARDRDSRPKKPGKYVCPYCGRACAKPSVLKKHIRSHTGERPYPCLACGFAFKTKSNLYKHRKSHAHAVKAGLVCGTDDGGSGDWTEIEKSFSLERSASAEKSLALEEQLGVGKLEIDQEAHSELDESTDTDDETAVEDASLDVKDYSARLLSESCFDYGQQRVKMSPCQTELSADTKGKHDGDRLQDNLQRRSGEENAERMSGSAKGSQGTGDMQSFLPRVVLVPPNPSASSSAQFTDSFRKPLTSDVNVCMEESEKQRSPKPKLNWSAKVTEEANLRSASSENLLRPNTFGSKNSTDSGYFSRSESADQPLTSPTNFHPLSYKDIVLGRNFPIHSRGRAMPNRVPEHIEEVSLKKERLVSSWTPSEHSISLNTERKPSNTQPTAQQATIDRSHVAGSIDSSSATDTYRDGGGTGTDDKMSKMVIAAAIYKPGPVKSEAGGEYLLVPSLETLGFPRSNSMPSYTRPDDTEVKTPVPLRGSHSFDELASTFHGDAYSSSSSNLYFANHRSLVRQTAVQADEFPVASESKVPTASQSSRVSMVGASQNLQDTGEGLNVGRRASPTTGEQHVRARRPARYSRGSFYECHTCKVTYKKVENYIVHKRLYCSELHMFPSSSNSSLEMESPAGDVAHEGETGAGKASDRSVLIRKRRKQRSVGDEEDMLTECVSASIAQPMLSGFIEEPYLDDHDSVFEKHDVPEWPRDVGVTAPVTVNSQAPKWQHSDPVKPQPPQLLVDGGSRRGLSLESGLSCYSNLGGHNEISVIQHTKSLSQPSSFERADSLETARSLSPDGCKGAQWSQQQQQCSLPALQATEHNKEDQASSADPLSIRGTKLVRQNNIQVPEILVTEEPDLVQPTDAPEKESEKKMEEDFSWPKRSETLSQLPPEKLPPKKKRLRLAELGNSSFESSTDSSFSGSLSRSPSLESNLSRCSSLSISLDRVELDDEKPKAEPEEKPRQEEVAFLTVPTSHHHRQHHHSREMRRSASEQARSPQYAGPGMAEIRSKSFDCGSISNSPPPPLGLDMDSSQPLTSSPLRERRKMCLVRQTSLSGYSEVQESLKEHIAFTSQAGLHPPLPRPASPALLSLRYCSPETSMRPPSPQSATQNMEDFKWQMGQKASYLHSLMPQISSCSPPRLPHSHHLPQSGHMQPPLPPFVHPSQAHNYELSLQHLSQTPQRLPYQLVHNHMLQLQAQQLLLRLPLQPFPQPPGVFYHQQGSPPRPRESYKQEIQHGLRDLDTAVQAEVVTYPAVTFSLGEPPQDEAGSDRLPSSRMQRSSAEGAWSSNSLVAPPLHHSKSSHKLVVHTTLAGLLSTQGPGSQPRVLFGQRGAALLSEKHTKLMRTDSAMRSSVLYPLYDNNKVVAVCASRQGISSQLDNQAPSSKRMLSPASSLEIAVDMRRQHYQKRVKEGEEESELREVEEEASLVIDKRDKSMPLIKSEGFTKSSSSFNSTDSSRSRKPTLVRQFCTMEPADREGSPANLTDSSSVQSMSSPSRDAKGMAASEDSMDEGSSKSPPLELGKRDNCSGRSAPEHEAGVLKSAASNADIEMKDSLGSPTTIKVLVPIVTTDMASSRATDSREEMAGGLGGPRRPPARAGVKVAVLHVVASGVSVPPSLVLVANIAEVQQLLSPSLRTVVSTTWCFLNGRARPAHCAEHHPGGAPGPSAYGQWTPPAPAGASAGDSNPPGASTAEALALLRRARGGHAGEGVYTLAAIAPRGACSTVHSRLWMPCMALALPYQHFTSNGTFYKQNEGTPMGSPLSPVIANAFMEKFEIDAIQTSTLRPSLWKRYVDDK